MLCLDPLDKGGCAASILRYYYNSASRMCEQFIYSGCGGSSNNFISRQSCMDVCAKGIIMAMTHVLMHRHNHLNVADYRRVEVTCSCGHDVTGDTE